MEVNEPSESADLQSAKAMMSLIDALKLEVQTVFGEGEASFGDARANNISASKIRSILKARRRRDRHFNPNLFGEAAWDILLELFASELEQSRISVSSVCSVSGVPSTTALRWIETLRREGLITRHDDPLDGRRTFVELTENGSAAMRRYFADIDEDNGVL